MPCSDIIIEIPAESLTSAQRVQLESTTYRVEVEAITTYRNTESRASRFGLAVDLGTTKLAAYLVNLDTGETIAQHGLMNPQIAYGEDVISRIHYASQSEERRLRLRQLVVDAINKLTDVLCNDASIRPDSIVCATVAGNTAMHHLFAELPVEQLGKAPYLPASKRSAQDSAKAMGLQLNNDAVVYAPPNLAGYVGGDHVAMLLGVDIQRCELPALAIDIGTNTELTLKVGGRLLTCSCASGPPFEGAHIHQGMRAAPGAIERVALHDGAIQFCAIDRQPARGVCGSGILDAIAVLLEAGVVDERGNFRQGKPGVRVKHGQPEFVLAGPSVAANSAAVILTRQDICEIQLAKAAIRAGIDVLLEAGGVQAAELKQFFIAGAFRSHLDPHSAIRIGLFPPIPVDRIQQVGNAAGLGARKMLASAAKRSEAETFAASIQYIELASHPGFYEKFAKGLLF